jgi:hypothetical protein
MASIDLGKRTSGKALARGALYGIVAAGLFACLFLLWGLVSAPFDGRELPADLVELVFQVYGVGVLVFLAALLPGVIGGVLVVCILRLLSRRRLISHGIGALVGALVGLLFGSAPAVALLMLTPRRALDIILPTGLAGALVGAWLGWQVAKWLIG